MMVPFLTSPRPSEGPIGRKPVLRSGRRLQRQLFTLAVICFAAQLRAASGQSCAVSCANSCGPRADVTAGVYNKCLGTCGTKCNACQTKQGTPGFVYPKYYVAGLFYAPPGCTKTATAACATQSTVDYSNGSSTGTKISTSSSFQSGVDVKVNASLGLGDKGGDGSFGLGGSFGYSTTVADTSSESLTKSSSLEEKSTGNQDGVNHDQDVFLLLLNPAIAVEATHAFVDGVCQMSGASWNFGLNTKLAPTQALFKVSVGELKNPALMPTDVAAQLKQLNFAASDYQTILALDPFASNPSASPAVVDPSRFIPTTVSFPYEPPDQTAECNGGVCNCLAISGAIKNELQLDHGTSSKAEYKVGASESLGINAGLFKIGESVDLSYAWDTTSTQDDITGSTQSATVTVQCPSVGYTGPTLMEVYWDTLYGSFVFAPTVLGSSSGTLLSQGTVTGATGQVLRHQPVNLVAGSKTFHTYTDSKGKYAFLVPATFTHPANGTVSVLGVTQKIAFGSTQKLVAKVK